MKLQGLFSYEIKSLKLHSKTNDCVYRFESNKMLVQNKGWQLNINFRHCFWENWIAHIYLLWWHNLPYHPESQTQVSSTHVPCLHFSLQLLRWGFALPISQWSPLNPCRHRHLLIPRHLPPFWHGIIHFAENKSPYNPFIVYFIWMSKISAFMYYEQYNAHECSNLCTANSINNQLELELELYHSHP